MSTTTPLPPLFLCLDCGGSKTAAAIADASGAIVARARGGPSNYAYVGHAAFLTAVATTAAAALAALVPPRALTDAHPPLAAASLGISGVDSPAAIAALTPALAALLRLPAARVHVANDTALLAAPLAAHPAAAHALVAIAGTGSIVASFARGPALRGRVGGWGWVLGDEGGGFHVGRQAVRAVVRAAERGAPPGALAAALVAHFRVRDVMDLLERVHLPDPAPGLAGDDDDEGVGAGAGAADPVQLPREKRLSTLAPLVFAAAFSGGDRLALGVLRACARALAGQIGELLVGGGRVPAARDAEADVGAGAGVGVDADGDDGVPPPLREAAAATSVLCLGGSLVGVPAYQALLLEALRAGGHEFLAVEWIADAAVAGAKALALAGTE